MRYRIRKSSATGIWWVESQTWFDWLMGGWWPLSCWGTESGAETALEAHLDGK